MNNFLFRYTLITATLLASLCQAQKPIKYNLNELYKHNKLVFGAGQRMNSLADGAREGISCDGIVWLKDVTFSTGSIDVDMRGKDVFQQSFLGIAFHGLDAVHYDAVYFRPFNFQSADTLRRKHMVQYISEPDYPWERLRKEHPLVFEHTVTPLLTPTLWFHVHIVVSNDDIVVFVNQSPVPSLKVKKLNSKNDGRVGLWVYALPGDFANLVIKPGK
jgi:hypothetical protein